MNLLFISLAATLAFLFALRASEQAKRTGKARIWPMLVIGFAGGYRHGLIELPWEEHAATHPFTFIALGLMLAYGAYACWLTYKYSAS